MLIPPHSGPMRDLISHVLDMGARLEMAWINADGTSAEVPYLLAFLYWATHERKSDRGRTTLSPVDSQCSIAPSLNGPWPIDAIVCVFENSIFQPPENSWMTLIQLTRCSPPLVVHGAQSTPIVLSCTVGDRATSHILEFNRGR